MKISEARDALASFLFTGEEVFEKVSTLSGGEKSRLRLLQLMQGNYNFLILDEPTNHLDLPSREVLEEALVNYQGTILVVSHDRYFLNKIAEFTYELESGQLTKYYGNYDYYREKKEKMEQDNITESEKKDNSKEDNFYYRKKREQRRERRKERKLEQLEEDILNQEQLKEELEEQMADPDNLDDYDLLNELKQRYEQVNEKLSALYKSWESTI